MKPRKLKNYNLRSKSWTGSWNKTVCFRFCNKTVSWLNSWSWFEFQPWSESWSASLFQFKSWCLSNFKPKSWENYRFYPRCWK